MTVAGIEIAPGIHDPDHRFAEIVRGTVAHLACARAMAKRTQIIATEPAKAAEVFGTFRAGGQ